MTCIVAKPGHMASDSRETGAIKRTCTKMFRRHGYIVGGAGASAPLGVLEHRLKWPVKLGVAELTRWIYQHHDPSYIDFDQCELVIASATRVWVVEGRSVAEAMVGAVGSGAAYALGYLEAKPNDLDGAVKAACKYDPYCAGPVRDLELK